jgi:N-succinyl-L-ornithine transcarbamylase
MKQFLSANDVEDVNEFAQQALTLKKDAFKDKFLGLNKTLGLVFMNPSLRTRLSTQKAAVNLGMNVMVMNFDKEGWALETDEGVVMNGTAVEHIREAAAVMGEYCDIIGIRCFPSLQDREKDYSEDILTKFVKYSGVPVVNLESSTVHPLQSLSDLITITEHATWFRKPKVVLTWAPHIKPLPQAVPNSFSQWMSRADVDFVIAHPKGYDLKEDFSKGAAITNNQAEALYKADFVYSKNWSSYRNYGKILPSDGEWMLTPEKMKITNNAYIMHCLPVRRGLELSDDLIDSEKSLILKQASNRVLAAQIVLKKMLERLQDKQEKHGRKVMSELSHE